MKVNKDDQMQILYREEQSDSIVFGRDYQKSYQIARSVWSYRLGAVAILFFIYILYHLVDFYYWWSTLTLSILSLFLLFASISERKGYRSATPIIIYNDGIQMYSSPFQRLMGNNGYLSKDKVRSITILRWYTILESRPDGDTMKHYRWNDVPAEFIIRTRKGKKHRSGMKHPDKLTDMVDIMRTEWGIPVQDKYGDRITNIEFERGIEEHL